MNVRTVKTDIIYPGDISLNELLDKYLDNVQEGSVVAVTSKIISMRKQSCSYKPC